jgi:3-dehydroquinate dehydratase/shikimate dehydrogenase
MYPNVDETPIPKKLLKPASLKLRRSGKDMTVFDTIYNPAETLLLKQAKEVGAKTISGLDMFISQAAEQFKLFTGKNADITFMRETIYNGIR